MTPSGDCPHCAKKERARAVAAGEIKRARDIKVGDSITPRFSFKPRVIDVETVKITTKGKVIVNEHKGHFGGEESFFADQWVDVCIKKRDGKCHDDSCDMSHCAQCGSHMLGGHLAHGTVCDTCSMEEEQRQSTQFSCTVHPEESKVRIFRGGNPIGYLSDAFSSGDPRLSLLSNQDGVAAITLGELEIIQDNWNFLQEKLRETATA